MDSEAGVDAERKQQHAYSVFPRAYAQAIDTMDKDK